MFVSLQVLFDDVNLPPSSQCDHLRSLLTRLVKYYMEIDNHSILIEVTYQNSDGTKLS